MSSDASTVKYQNMELASVPSPVFIRDKTSEEMKAERIYNANCKVCCGSGMTSLTCGVGTLAFTWGSFYTCVIASVSSFAVCSPIFCCLLRSDDIKECCQKNWR